MKRHSLTLLMLLAIATLHAQEKATTEEKKEAFTPTFTAKFAPIGLAIGKITFGGELNFKHKQSVTLLVGLPFDKTRNIKYDDTDNDLTEKVTSVMAGYRYYLGKRDKSGLYLEPYVKYVKLEARGFLTDDLNGQPARFDSRFEYKGVGVGLQLGVQFFIAKRVAIDFFFLGPEANSAKISASATDVYDNIPWTLADAQEAERNIKDALEDIPVIGDKTEVKVNTATKNVTASYKGFAPGFRAGASIGFRF
jgi:hypothetical protein